MHIYANSTENILCYHTHTHTQTWQWHKKSEIPHGTMNTLEICTSVNNTHKRMTEVTTVNYTYK
jgi:hypothetical protein